MNKLLRSTHVTQYSRLIERDGKIVQRHGCFSSLYVKAVVNHLTRKTKIVTWCDGHSCPKGEWMGEMSSRRETGNAFACDGQAD